MKSLSQYLTEVFKPVHYDEENHIITYNLHALSQDDKSYRIGFNDLGLGITSKDRAFQYAEVDIDYDNNVMALRAPGQGKNPRMRVWTFKPKHILARWNYNRMLSGDDLEPYITNKPYNVTGQDKKLDHEIAGFVAWLFNCEPEPLFNTPPKEQHI